MAFRVPPTGLAKHVNNLIKGNLLKKAPVWLPVVQAIPPGPSIIRSQQAQVNVNAQTPAEQALSSPLSTNTSIRHKQKHLRTKPPRPHAIVYPEDRLRRQFYKDHPFELSRPKVLVENDDGLNRTDFSQLMLPGMRLSEVDGEAVIKYQLHLMTEEGMPERKAYAKATSEFYLIRAQQEKEEREAREKMTKLLQNTTSNKYSKKALYHEEQALLQGQAMNN
ncbi:mitochondrial ribosomal protein S25 [Halteromyces radiatus]|uniref:mitochondrial ribosomal protein S25 n=1 Tax=Halteromyces radiatus TaxID=101107 RepID=UPI00221F06C6|nr:mitochondrial ribosomal protein S25 [Halteromyces radiatus]KAI8085120.1 mitochondrial ribosomal protein S25 [Halteromyces radiatus]